MQLQIARQTFMFLGLALSFFGHAKSRRVPAREGIDLIKLSRVAAEDEYQGRIRVAALVIPAECSEAAAFERAEETRYVARQGVSLRIAVSGRAELAFQGDGDRATRTMLDNAAVFGLAQLSGGLRRL